MLLSAGVSSSRVCKYFKLKAVNGPKCKRCDTVFHSKCVGRFNLDLLNDHSVLCCEVFGNAASPDKSNELLNFEMSPFAGSGVVTFFKE